MKLDPTRTPGEAALGLGKRVDVRVDAAERNQHAVGPQGGVDHAVVGVGVALRLVHREHERAARTRQLEPCQ